MSVTDNLNAALSKFKKLPPYDLLTNDDAVAILSLIQEVLSEPPTIDEVLEKGNTTDRTINVGGLGITGGVLTGLSVGVDAPLTISNVISLTVEGVGIVKFSAEIQPI